ASFSESMVCSGLPGVVLRGAGKTNNSADAGRTVKIAAQKTAKMIVLRKVIAYRPSSTGHSQNLLPDDRDRGFHDPAKSGKFMCLGQYAPDHAGLTGDRTRHNESPCRRRSCRTCRWHRPLFAAGGLCG